ncbi:Serine/threonine-protein kinase NIM1 [Portunus trituberculatus]|uniref:Serine/threonine-protein kinase NIM1 n=1 Tax=Portunus trituberculatus TaxID=210409 RepID=A0A5B7ETN7_PORTR|nr:Serine/threonine-protein kinase NIM1 [Portunus trituberculatus]
MLWGLQAHGFESCLRSECRLGFLARDNSFLADKVAIKVIDKSKLDQKTQRMLAREIANMDTLAHPNIISTLSTLFRSNTTTSALTIFHQHFGNCQSPVKHLYSTKQPTNTPSKLNRNSPCHRLIH